MDDYSYIKKILSIGFMTFLDSHRRERKMCLSNAECANIEKAFDTQDWAKLARYARKYIFGDYDLQP